MAVSGGAGRTLVARLRRVRRSPRGVRTVSTYSLREPMGSSLISGGTVLVGAAGTGSAGVFRATPRQSPGEPTGSMFLSGEWTTISATSGEINSDQAVLRKPRGRRSRVGLGPSRLWV